MIINRFMLNSSLATQKERTKKYNHNAVVNGALIMQDLSPNCLYVLGLAQ